MQIKTVKQLERETAGEKKKDCEEKKTDKEAYRKKDRGN